MKAWSPLLYEVDAPQHAEALSDVRQLLGRLTKAFGAAPTARMLDVNRAMLTRWKRGSSISPEMSRRIIDLHDILNRALQVMQARTALYWLIGNNAHLGGARPLEVLALRGAAPVIEALQAFEDLSYA